MQLSLDTYPTPSSNFMIPELTSTKSSSISDDPRNLVKVSVTPTPLTYTNSNETLIFSSDYNYNDKPINNTTNINSIVSHATLPLFCNNSNTIENTQNSANIQTKMNNLSATTIPILLPINADNSTSNSNSNNYDFSTNSNCLINYNNSYNFNDNYGGFYEENNSILNSSQDSEINNYYSSIKNNFYTNTAIYSDSNSSYSNSWAPVLQVGIKRGHWTQEEDQLIINAMREVTEGGELKWSEISKRLKGLRSGKQCRERWANHLRPSLRKGKWSPREDSLLLQAQARLGNAWTKIALEIPGRSENEVKNRWYSTIVRRNLHLKKTTETCNSSSTPSNILDEIEDEFNNEDEPTKKRIRYDINLNNNQIKEYTNSTSLLPSFYNLSKELVNIIKDLSNIYKYLNLPNKSEANLKKLNLSNILYDENFNHLIDIKDNLDIDSLNFGSTINSNNNNSNNSNNNNNNNNNNNSNNNNSNNNNNNSNNNSNNSGSNNSNSLNNYGSKGNQDENLLKNKDDEDNPNDIKYKKISEKLSDEESLYIKLAEIYLESIKTSTNTSNIPLSIPESFTNSVIINSTSTTTNSNNLNSKCKINSFSETEASVSKSKGTNSSSKSCLSMNIQKQISNNIISEENSKSLIYDPIFGSNHSIEVKVSSNSSSVDQNSKSDIKSTSLDFNNQFKEFQNSLNSSLCSTETQSDNELGFFFESKPSSPIIKSMTSKISSPKSNSLLIDYDLKFLHEAHKISLNNNLYSESENLSFFNSLNNFMCSSGLTSPVDTPLLSRVPSPSPEDKNTILNKSAKFSNILPNEINNNSSSLQSSTINLSTNNSNSQNSNILNYFHSSSFQDFFENIYIESNQDEENY